MPQETTPKTRKPRAPKATNTPVLRPALPQKEDGSVDWKQIVTLDNLLLNFNYWAAKGINIDSLDDEERTKLKKESPEDGVFILLAGFRQIAKARGVRSTRFRLEHTSPHSSVVTCVMTLVPTEEEPYEVEISGVANSSVDNTKEEYAIYPEAMASNRAECRAWRQYLNLKAVSFEEVQLGPKAEVTSTPQPVETLLEKLEEAGKSLPFIEELAGDLDLGNWGGRPENLSPAICFTLIGKLKNLSA